MDYQALEFEYRSSPDQQAATPAFHPVIVVGAGPVGLSLAIDLAQRGIRVLLLDNDHKLSTGSRAICFAKRTLEIFDRLGCCDRMVDKGVSWKLGRVYFGDEEVYQFDLLPEPGHERPAFINLQQYYVEGFLAERAQALPNLEIRWSNTVTGIEQNAEEVLLTVDTPEGPYRLRAGHVAACDGARSPLRGLLGLESRGRSFRDRFLIADVRIAGMDLPCERRFWFDPPFHPGQSVLLHKQADDVWRIDFQLGWDANPDEEKKPEHILPRVRAVLDSIGAAGCEVEIVWASVYTFACLRMERFRQGRVLFAGDSAHGVSPFGARGANSGVQDAENLAWKLALVSRGDAPDALLDSYAGEREFAADENILNSTRATDFITPKSEISRMFRDAVLDLSREHAFARKLVNSGRLSVPAVLRESPLNTADVDAFEGAMVPGAPAADAPLGNGKWLLRELGPDFTLLVFGGTAWAEAHPTNTRIVHLDADGLAAQRYDARPGTTYLIRPDLHVAARWRHPTAAAVQAAIARACAKATPC
ncbi:MAG TPA: FAD-dependent oxidoreductase [Albitalea sp.]|uniref:FAD-dependent oxidoreductase n=1 Tax=Piscinibacter sp. TaxID=1903157 RepID=UPI002ED517E5